MLIRVVLSCHSIIFIAVMSPPSRILPQRAWAAAVPTLLSHEGLTKLLTASMLPGYTQFLPASPLERFFACVHLRRHMQRVIQSETPVSVRARGVSGLRLSGRDVGCLVFSVVQHVCVM